MSERLHPDIDSLNAFAQGALSAPEHLECLAHLAECAQCRDVVFLAQEPQNEIAPPRVQPVAWWRRFVPAAALAAVAICMIGLWVASRHNAPVNQQIAQVTPKSQASETTPETPAISPTSSDRKTQPQPTLAAPRHSRASQDKPSVARPSSAPSAPDAAPQPELAVSSPAPSIVAPSITVEPLAPASPSPQTTPAAVAPPPVPRTVAPETAVATLPPTPISGISGTVIDLTGAAIAGARVDLRQVAGAKKVSALSDASGQFMFGDLPPGRYQLQIAATGFQSNVQSVVVRPQEMAMVKPELTVGSVSETVTVTASATMVETSSAQVSNRAAKKAPKPIEPSPLPSKLPAALTATHGKTVVSTDSAGALYYSGNSGKSWKAVKPLWNGSVTDLVSPPDASQPSSVVFQLTTDANQIWLSRDGRRWYSAPNK